MDQKQSTKIYSVANPMQTIIMKKNTDHICGKGRVVIKEGYTTNAKLIPWIDMSLIGVFVMYDACPTKANSATAE